MKKPKIAIIVSHPIQHFCPQYESYTKRNDWEIKVFFASAAGSMPYIDPDFNKVISWNNLNLNSFTHEFLNGEKVIPITSGIDADNLEERLENYSPDIVLVYGYIQKLQRRAKNWANKKKIKVFMISDSELRKPRKLINKAIKKFILPRYYRRIDAFLTTGDANEAYYRYYGVTDRKFFRTPHPIDIQLFENAFIKREELRNSLKEKLNIEKSRVVLSVVGKLVKWKNQIDVIKALLLLDEKMKNITLLIVGTGDMEGELLKTAKRLNHNQVQFTGFIDAKKLPEYYAATDLYIHPSYIEPHSVAISEAIYMGCPVILSSNCGSYGPNDDVQPGRNGFVYEYGNINELAQKIRLLANNPKLIRKFGEASRNFAVRSQALAHSEGMMAALISNGFISNNERC